VEDANVVRRCLDGDGAAWEGVVRTHTRRIYNLCYRFTGRREEAEDLAQEVFLRVFRTLNSYDPEQGALGVWMHRVARNLLIDHYRATRKERYAVSLDDAMPRLEQKESGALRPDRALAQVELSAAVQQGLTRLSPDLREAVILRDLQAHQPRPGGTGQDSETHARVPSGRNGVTMSWTCAQFDARRHDYLEGQLSAEEAAGAQAHVDACARCAEWADGRLAALWLREVEPMEVPPGLETRILAQTLAPAPEESFWSTLELGWRALLQPRHQRG
jgi:RNA polymerase sigma factor (sigma-70 family)